MLQAGYGLTLTDWKSGYGYSIGSLAWGSWHLRTARKRHVTRKGYIGAVLHP